MAPSNEWCAEQGYVCHVSLGTAKITAQGSHSRMLRSCIAEPHAWDVRANEPQHKGPSKHSRRSWQLVQPLQPMD